MSTRGARGSHEPIMLPWAPMGCHGMYVASIGATRASCLLRAAACYVVARASSRRHVRGAVRTCLRASSALLEDAHARPSHFSVLALDVRRARLHAAARALRAAHDALFMFITLCVLRVLPHSVLSCDLCGFAL